MSLDSFVERLRAMETAYPPAQSDARKRPSLGGSMFAGFAIAILIEFAFWLYVRFGMVDGMYELAAIALLILLLPVTVVAGLVVLAMRWTVYAVRPHSPEQR